MRYIIIGAGVAGISAAEQLRRLKPDAEITVINGESYPFYRRLSLSMYLQGHTALAALTVKQPADYENSRIDVVTGRVSRLEPSSNSLYLETGDQLSYDGLILATGGHPIAPPIPGITLKGVRLGYWDLDDALWYEDQLKQIKSAVIIGAGVLGLELADCCNKAGINVTMLQLGDRLGEPLTDVAAGVVVAERVRESGADFRIGTSASEIVGNADGQVVAVRASNGEEFPADLVGVCIGIRPNVAFLEESGLTVEHGCIVVDEHLRTNIPNIYAAGDCTWVKSGTMVGQRPNRTWQVATLQGMTAAMNLAGEVQDYSEGLFYNAGVLYDLPYTLLGQFNATGEGYSSRTYDPGTDAYAYFKLTFKDGQLVGALLLGRQKRTQILRKIMEGQMSVAGFEDQLMNPKFKPDHLKDVAVNAGDRDVEAKLAAYNA